MAPWVWKSMPVLTAAIRQFEFASDEPSRCVTGAALYIVTPQTELPDRHDVEPEPELHIPGRILRLDRANPSPHRRSGRDDAVRNARVGVDFASSGGRLVPTAERHELGT